MLYDVHCHIIDDDPSQYPLISQLKTQRLCLMGTCPSDWPSVRDMAKQYSEKIQPAFGLHPWFAERDATSPTTTTTNNAASSSSSEHDIWWLPLLRNYLTEHPNAIVGEIGLDKIARDRETGQQYNQARQQEAFAVQFDLAAELTRPVSVHCVQHQGALMDYLLERAKHATSWPPSIMLHSYTGSADTVKRLLRLEKQLVRSASSSSSSSSSSSNDHSCRTPRFYFSISSVINERCCRKTEQWLREVPIDRLLLESDIHRVDQVDPLMEQVCSLVSELSSTSLSIDEIKQQTWQNAQTFFGLFTSNANS